MTPKLLLLLQIQLVQSAKHLPGFAHSCCCIAASMSAATVAVVGATLLATTNMMLVQHGGARRHSDSPVKFKIRPQRFQSGCSEYKLSRHYCGCVHTALHFRCCCCCCGYSVDCLDEYDSRYSHGGARRPSTFACCARLLYPEFRVVVLLPPRAQRVMASAVKWGSSSSYGSIATLHAIVTAQRERGQGKRHQHLESSQQLSATSNPLINEAACSMHHYPTLHFE